MVNYFYKIKEYSVILHSHKQQTMRKTIALCLTLVLLCAACGSSRKGASDDKRTGEREILIITGTISYDSVDSRYDIAVSNRQIVPGVLSLADDPVTGSDIQGLNYAQLGKKDRVLSVHRMDNPLVQQIEYHEGDVLGRKTVHLSKSAFNLRIQLNPGATRILVRDGENTITSIPTETK